VSPTKFESGEVRDETVPRTTHVRDKGLIHPDSALRASPVGFTKGAPLALMIFISLLCEVLWGKYFSGKYSSEVFEHV